MIPFLDLSEATQELRAELDDAYHRFMDSGWYVLGAEVESFEAEYAAYCEAEHCVGVGTGLDALTLALKALAIGIGDEVIVPSNTYIATWLAVTQVGATIIPVEPDIRTFNLDPHLVAQAITKRTRAILAVNLYGQPVDYDSLSAVAEEGGTHLLIDNAQAQGARYKGKRVGGLAKIECHSFYPSKNLGAFGEAGAITTNDSKIADRIKLLRNYGSKERYYNEECGTNSRLDALQASFLRVKLRHLDTWNQRRTQIAETYQRKLQKLPGIVTPHSPPWANPAWHLYVIQCKQRDDIRTFLNQREIGTQVHYPIPPHLSNAYKQLRLPISNLPIAEDLALKVLSLPMGPHLSHDQASHVCTALNQFVSK